MEGRFVQVDYTSKDVPIPDDFLAGPPPAPTHIQRIDFASSTLPEYAECIALTIDNILSPAECKQLLELAESSVLDRPGGQEENTDTPWRPATVSSGGGRQALATHYRNGDRIIWDHQTVVDRVWERASHTPGLVELFAQVVPEGSPEGQKWAFRRLNQRMRFLRYGPGQFFTPHYDAQVHYENSRGAEFMTHFTAHIYLNDSSTTADGLQGGATSFLSSDRSSRVDVSPKAGSMLIFQQADMLHEGARVYDGVKYTVRMELFYEWLDGWRRGDAAE